MAGSRAPLASSAFSTAFGKANAVEHVGAFREKSPDIASTGKSAKRHFARTAAIAALADRRS
jgi:hypothetical protein